MKILVVGSGGREHALVWKLAQGKRVKKIFAAPGNAGMAELAESVPIAAGETTALADFAASSRVDLTVVGPEAPLVDGMVDQFQQGKLPIFGPTQAAARLEGSKGFAKALMQRHGVPTARFQLFEDLEKALEHLKAAPMPIVIKADGLAAGKGVFLASTQAEAAEAVTRILRDRVFAGASAQVVIEECLSGEEVSVLALVDGEQFTLLAPSQDHKRALDQDRGPNTGGMGAYSPVPMLGSEQIDQIRRRIFEPVIRGMAGEGAPFRGVLYAGLMLTAEGPKVLEFNVRFGDPEIQAVLPRLKSDLAELMLAALEGRLGEACLDWDAGHAACVVLASQGYPGRYDVGREITGLREAAALPGTLIFHAGTERQGGRLVTNGGRVLNVVGLGGSLEAALENAYRAVERIRFEGKQFRRDIGFHALRRGERVNPKGLKGSGTPGTLDLDSQQSARGA